MCRLDAMLRNAEAFHHWINFARSKERRLDRFNLAEQVDQRTDATKVAMLDFNIRRFFRACRMVQTLIDRREHFFDLLPKIEQSHADHLDAEKFSHFGLDI
jgi:hypothetical protein